MGKGASALVIKAKKATKDNSQLIALKIVEFDEENQKAMGAVLREYSILKSLQTSDYIVKLNDQFYLTEEEESENDPSVI